MKELAAWQDKCFQRLYMLGHTGKAVLTAFSISERSYSQGHVGFKNERGRFLKKAFWQEKRRLIVSYSNRSQ